jgi:hypothetical protein
MKCKSEWVRVRKKEKGKILEIILLDERWVIECKNKNKIRKIELWNEWVKKREWEKRE